jgi:polyphosphate kinase
MLVRKGVQTMEAGQAACLHEELLPRLAASGISVLSWSEQEVRRRRFGAVVRVEVSPETPRQIRKLLMRQLEVQDVDLYDVAGLLGASDLIEAPARERRARGRLPAALSRAGSRLVL